MSCVQFRSADGAVTGFLHMADIFYVYVKGKRMYFEFHPYCGVDVYRDFEKEKFYTRPPKEFWDKFTKWLKRRESKKK